MGICACVLEHVYTVCQIYSNHETVQMTPSELLQLVYQQGFTAIVEKDQEYNSGLRNK